MRDITITATDPLSKIWKTTDAPTGITNSAGIIYRTGPKANVAALMFDAGCNVTPIYATISETETVGFPTSATATLNNFDPTLKVLTYCVQDNAGNVTR